jgi:hypothetical protein
MHVLVHRNVCKLDAPKESRMTSLNAVYLLKIAEGGEFDNSCFRHFGLKKDTFQYSLYGFLVCKGLGFLSAVK